MTDGCFLAGARVPYASITPSPTWFGATTFAAVADPKGGLLRDIRRELCDFALDTFRSVQFSKWQSFSCHERRLPPQWTTTSRSGMSLFQLARRNCPLCISDRARDRG